MTATFKFSNLYMNKRLLSTLALAAVMSAPIRANVADSIHTTVSYRVGTATLELKYDTNSSRLDSLVENIKLMADKGYTLNEIRIYSSASPEGSVKLNQKLARKRGDDFRKFLSQKLSVSDSMFTVVSVDEDWDALADIVDKQCSDKPWHNDALSILRNTPVLVWRNGKIVDSRKRQLMNLRGGSVWWYLYKHYFHLLRRSTAIIYVKTDNDAISDSHKSNNGNTTGNTGGNDNSNNTTANTDCKAVGDNSNGDNSAIDESNSNHNKDFADSSNISNAEELAPFYMAVRTNMLYDVAFVPNVGLEFYLGKNWSIGGSWMYAWWKTDRHHRYWRIYGGEIDVRRYFGGSKPLSGHHIGVYAQGFTYDFELGGTGYLSHFTYGVGLEYGYSFPVARRLNIDLGIGFGYWGGKYKVYDPIDTHYVWRETKNRRWIGPTKAEISLVWLIGHGNVNAKKGGKR